MTMGRWQTVAVVGFVALSLASCAREQRRPTAQAPAPAQPSPQAAQQARTTQEELAQAQRTLEAAHQEVATAQQQLAQAQRKEEQARASVQQLEIQARRDLDRASQLAHQAEQAQGLQAATGRVAQATPSRVLLQTDDGRMMSFQIDQRTRVLVGSAQRSVSDIQQGADARIAYEAKGTEQTAITIRIAPVGSDLGGSPASPPSALDSEPALRR